MIRIARKTRDAVAAFISQGERGTLAALARQLGVSRQMISAERKRIAPTAPRLKPGPRRMGAH